MRITEHTLLSEIDSASAEFAAHFGGLERFAARYRHKICPLHLILQEAASSVTVLDIGCGNGLLLYLLARSRRMASGVGIDTSHRDISNGRAALTRSGLASVELNVVTNTADWPSGAFDVVTMVDVMHHVPPTLQSSFFMEATCRVRPGGKFVYKDMARSPVWMAWGNRLHDLVKARQWIHYVPIAQLEGWAEAAGLTLIKSCRVDQYIYGHELRVFERR